MNRYRIVEYDNKTWGVQERLVYFFSFWKQIHRFDNLEAAEEFIKIRIGINKKIHQQRKIVRKLMR